MVEDARAQIEAQTQRGRVAARASAASSSSACCNRAPLLTAAGTLLYLYEASGLKALVRGMGC